MKEQPEHDLLLRWLILTGLILFSLVVAWNENIISLLFYVDKSRISWVISLIYLLVTLHCARRIYTVSLQTKLSRVVGEIIKRGAKLEFRVDNDNVIINPEITLPDCYMTDYINDIYVRNRNILDEKYSNIQTDLIDVYESRLKGPQEIGWFVSDMMLKLGLLGTIIGFIFMLGSVATISDFDINNMQKILRHMSNGMGTALYTTLAGLICSILSAMQYHMLDRHADELIELVRHLTEVHVIPKLKQS